MPKQRSPAPRRGRPAILDDGPLLLEKLTAVMSGNLLTYQDGIITITGDPDGKCKATVYFGGVEGWSVEILPDDTVLLNGLAMNKGGLKPTVEQINEGLYKRLEQMFGPAKEKIDA